MSLDLNNQSMPYRIGRLFAVLEKARKDANKGDLSNYYTDAMKTPSTTFPKLIQLVHSEAGEKYQNLIHDIVDSMTNFLTNFHLWNVVYIHLVMLTKEMILWKKKTDKR